MPAPNLPPCDANIGLESGTPCDPNPPETVTPPQQTFVGPGPVVEPAPEPFTLPPEFFQPPDTTPFATPPEVPGPVPVFPGVGLVTGIFAGLAALFPTPTAPRRLDEPSPESYLAPFDPLLPAYLLPPIELPPVEDIPIDLPQEPLGLLTVEGTPPAPPPPIVPIAEFPETPPNWLEIMLTGYDPALQELAQRATAKRLHMARMKIAKKIASFLNGQQLRDLVIPPLGEPQYVVLPAQLPAITTDSPEGLPGFMQPITLPGRAPRARPVRAPTPLAAPAIGTGLFPGEGLAPGTIPAATPGEAPAFGLAPAISDFPLRAGGLEPGAPGIPPMIPGFASVTPQLGQALDPQEQLQRASSSKKCQAVQTKQKQKQKRRKRSVCHTGVYIEHTKGLTKHPRRVIQCR